MFRILKNLFIALVILVLLTTCIIAIPLKVKTLNSSFMISMHTDSAPRLVAHRGLSSLYPQNTIPAFEGAHEYGFEAFELDIHTTKDGKWVVIHDDTVNDMTDGEGEVSDFTLNEISQLKIDNGNNIDMYENLSVPTLKETLDICNKADIIPVIEIKKCDVQYLPSLKDMLDEYKLSGSAVIISFTKEYLEEYRKLDSDIEILYLKTVPTKEDIDWCIENNFGINFNCWCLYKCLDAIRYAKEKDVTIGAWTVDNTVIADVMVLIGAKYITTNKILP